MANYAKVDTADIRFNISPALSFTPTPYGVQIGLDGPSMIKRVLDNLEIQDENTVKGVHVESNTAGGLGCYLHIPLSKDEDQIDIRQIGWINANQKEVDLSADEDEIERIQEALFDMPRKSATATEGAEALSFLT